MLTSMVASFWEERTDSGTQIKLAADLGKLRETAPATRTSLFRRRLCGEPPEFSGSTQSTENDKAAAWSLKELLEQLRRATADIETTLAGDPCLCMALESNALDRQYVNSEGVERHTRQVWHSFTLASGEHDVGGISDIASDPEELSSKLLRAREILSERAELIGHAALRVPPKKPVPLILAPTVAGVLFHELFGHGAEMGWYGLAPNTKVGPRALRIVARYPVSSSYDDEGVAVADFPVVDTGRLGPRLYDRATAAARRASPAGLAQAGPHGGAPCSRCTHLYVSPGTVSKNEILSDVSWGLLCDSAARAFVTNGVVVLEIHFARVIRDGEIGEAVRPFLIMVSLATVSQRIQGISSESVATRGGLCVKDGIALPSLFVSPYILMEGVGVIPA
jgi:predicted Zn-dependent protease